MKGVNLWQAGAFLNRYAQHAGTGTEEEMLVLLETSMMHWILKANALTQMEALGDAAWVRELIAQIGKAINEKDGLCTILLNSINIHIKGQIIIIIKDLLISVLSY